ncbi:hypothetical protein [Victivallis sp. Marseille-Q1083]|uniref:hypothetical protein n=1 Tax=Victivallis sp. Marseille-Q1083 TaxID=2717288 RepID=UPI0015892660|nr:hypothetical protein [Victivallis sp. Marseille-Q1083]
MLNIVEAFIVTLFLLNENISNSEKVLTLDNDITISSMDGSDNIDKGENSLSKEDDFNEFIVFFDKELEKYAKSPEKYYEFFFLYMTATHQIVRKDPDRIDGYRDEFIVDFFYGLPISEAYEIYYKKPGSLEAKELVWRRLGAVFRGYPITLEIPIDEQISIIKVCCFLYTLNPEEFPKLLKEKIQFLDGNSKAQNTLFAFAAGANIDIAENYQFELTGDYEKMKIISEKILQLELKDNLFKIEGESQ